MVSACVKIKSGYSHWAFDSTKCLPENPFPLNAANGQLVASLKPLTSVFTVTSFVVVGVMRPAFLKIRVLFTVPLCDRLLDLSSNKQKDFASLYRIYIFMLATSSESQ